MTVQVLLVEDNPGDARLMQEAFQEAHNDIELHVVRDGVEAMDFLQQSHAPLPNLILLDLNLPRLDGRQVLAHIKSNDTLKSIPTVILTTSVAEMDIITSYQLHANAYLTKPARMASFALLVESIEEFWLAQVKLPKQLGG